MKINIALIAHDGKKSDMVSFILNNSSFLKDANLFATGTTTIRNIYKIKKVLPL
mgnify:CR=1 FL=1